jgi:anti-sigma regulatory factor (Ser/Thr protein kinase)
VPQAHAANQNAVREFVIQAIRAERPHLAKEIQRRFDVSRPTAHNYIEALIQAGVISRTGLGQYALSHQKHSIVHDVKGLQEHEVWEDEIAPILEGLPPNVIDILHYGCTEMINNVIDHSESDSMLVSIDRTPAETHVTINDSGIGIFKKIARALNLEDERHAVLELSKGKVTTDPERHTGEGIFFSSRAFDDFRILSGGVYFRHELDDEEDWILAQDEPPAEEPDGTGVFMTLENNTQRTLKGVFDEYATDTEDYRFDRTVVPVKLLQYGDDKLVSRSQAKRLMTRFDRFRIVVLDFKGVDAVGQSFADEVFRVFVSKHPELEIVPVNANEQVARMINRAQAGQRPQRDLFPVGK